MNSDERAGAHPLDQYRSSEVPPLHNNEVIIVETSNFPIMVQGRPDFEAALYSKTLGTHSDAHVVVRNDKLSAPHDVTYNFGEDASKSISARIGLRPGKNTITFSLSNGEQGGQPEEVNLDVMVAGRIYNSGEVEFLLQEESQAVDDVALDRVAGLTKLMNGYLENPVSQVYIRDAEFPAGSAMDHKLTLSRFNFDSPTKNPFAIAWHELAHFYYNELEGDKDDQLRPEDQQRPYTREFRILYQEALQLSQVADATDKSWKSIRPNSIMEVFNSETYINGADPSLGRPQLHAGELFAYGSDILLFHTDEFLQRVSELGSEEEKDIAILLAAKIANVYTQDGVLPEMLQGLERFI